MYKISPELLQALANYLQTQPYGNVYVLINELSKLEKVEEKPQEKK